ncbi:Acyl-protein synthetase, LuxE [Rubritalea squalenifaciens DSM 18772]|uniref:Acyl-protein synthetase, LuxE n=1 Tax=Rubritalea squalenifaciens DSM 18772 TaxID=1123071 RepID=A0A1M6RRD8_9BACT|nr:AMP-binding protein [Rubritalea squalenifaciens]SHK35015.1 Acyl-protein synthetase, LuxE [Rubritalea squalenifaciens DSM 18772]
MEIEAITAELIEAISNESPQEWDFDSLAKKIFAYQYAHNAPYRAYCDAHGISPSEELHWQDIPAVPTDAFKSTNNPTCLPEEKRGKHFKTSGTTGETQGTHYFQDTSLYEKSIIEGWKDAGLPAIYNCLILSQPPEEMPHSSLVHMMQTLRDHFAPEATFLIREGHISIAKIRQAIQQGSPITIFGTALAFLHLFESIDEPLELPDGSWAMETGGYKGSGRSLSKKELYALFEEKLGLPASRIWNEYSMTELSSQFYTREIDRPHSGPPWTRIKVVNPETGAQVKPGETGYLHIYDLANLHSVLAIRTQDLATYHDERSFTLIGRDPSAIPRGCSRSADETLSR